MYLFFIINIKLSLSYVHACRLLDAQLEKHNVGLIRLKLTG